MYMRYLGGAVGHREQYYTVADSLKHKERAPRARARWEITNGARVTCGYVEHDDEDDEPMLDESSDSGDDSGRAATPRPAPLDDNPDESIPNSTHEDVEDMYLNLDNNRDTGGGTGGEQQDSDSDSDSDDNGSNIDYDALENIPEPEAEEEEEDARDSDGELDEQEEDDEDDGVNGSEDDADEEDEFSYTGFARP